jgi:hypothetical protein
MAKAIAGRVPVGELEFLFGDLLVHTTRSS